MPGQEQNNFDPLDLTMLSELLAMPPAPEKPYDLTPVLADIAAKNSLTIGVEEYALLKNFTPKLEASESYSHTHYQRIVDARAHIESGVMPPVGNGFSFVFDSRPEDETGFVPTEDYTRYFSQRKIPLAATGTLRDHDILHIPGYQTIFAQPAVARTVVAAATNALSSPEGCQKFAKYMDGLGDHIRNIESEERGEVFAGFVNGGRLSLAGLVELATGELPNSIAVDDQPASEAAKLLAELSTALRLDHYSAIATYKPIGMFEEYCPVDKELASTRSPFKLSEEFIEELRSGWDK